MTEKDFIDVYFPLNEDLYRVAYYILESSRDAEDAVQDLYVKLWNSLDSLDYVNNPRAYCINALRNLCIDKVRRASHMLPVAMPETLTDVDDVVERIEKVEKVKAALSAVRRLPSKQKEVLRLRVFEGLSYKEIAERTGISSLTARVLVSQARRKINGEI